MKKIKLTQGKWALVDDADHEFASSFRWSAMRQGTRWCAVRYFKNNRNKYMHREIIGARKGFVVDHIDGNALNNQRSNLRECTVRENIRNQNSRRKTVGKSSIFKGVHWYKRDQKWKATIGFTTDENKHKVIHIGTYIQEKDAARAYDKKSLEIYGEFARPNFPRRNHVKP